MLCCGRKWQPTCIERVIESFPTSTMVCKVATDKGNCFLKGMGNPSGNDALISELVCGELAAWIGLRIPDFAIIDFNGPDIILQN